MKYRMPCGWFLVDGQCLPELSARFRSTTSIIGELFTVRLHACMRRWFVGFFVSAALSRAADYAAGQSGVFVNQSCVHCHVNAGPTRTEQMTAETVDLVLEYAQSAEVATLDLTAGRPS